MRDNIDDCVTNHADALAKLLLASYEVSRSNNANDTARYVCAMFSDLKGSKNNRIHSLYQILSKIWDLSICNAMFSLWLKDFNSKRYKEGNSFMLLWMILSKIKEDNKKVFDDVMPCLWLIMDQNEGLNRAQKIIDTIKQNNEESQQKEIEAVIYETMDAIEKENQIQHPKETINKENTQLNGCLDILAEELISLIKKWMQQTAVKESTYREQLIKLIHFVISKNKKTSYTKALTFATQWRLYTNRNLIKYRKHEVAIIVLNKIMEDQEIKKNKDALKELNTLIDDEKKEKEKTAAPEVKKCVDLIKKENNATKISAIKRLAKELDGENGEVVMKAIDKLELKQPLEKDFLKIKLIHDISAYIDKKTNEKNNKSILKTCVGMQLYSFFSGSRNINDKIDSATELKEALGREAIKPRAPHSVAAMQGALKQLVMRADRLQQSVNTPPDASIGAGSGHNWEVVCD